MAFKSFENIQLARFNSDNSSDFLDLYENALDETILEGESRIPSRTFAPSTIRCKRVSWFRLRGVAPETETIVDRSLNFTAQMGTACHRTIQEILSKKLGKDWIDAETYLGMEPRKFQYTCVRMYGKLKCYEVTVTDTDMNDMWDMFSDVQRHVAMNIAPEKPQNTRYCTPSYCRYYNRCKEW